MVDLSHSASRVNVSCMDKTIEVTSFLIKFQELFVSKVLFVWALGRQNHFDALLELLFAELGHLCLKAI